MGSQGEKSAGIKELLRSMLRAWHEFTKEEAGGFAAGATADAEEELKTEEQQAAMIVSVLFHGWKMHALNPWLREKRQPLPSNAEWVQRMTSPITPRGGGDQKEGGQARLQSQTKSGFRGAEAHRLGTRYMRVRTIPPERIRYGRSPVASPPPQGLKPHRSFQVNDSIDQSNSLQSTRNFSSARQKASSSRLMRGARKRFVPRHQRKASRQLVRNFEEDGEEFSERGSSDDTIDALSERLGRGRRADAGMEHDHGYRTLNWHQMEPWEQRNASFQICGLAGEAVQRSAASEKILREVRSRVEHYNNLEQRQRRALMLCRQNQTEFSCTPGAAEATSVGRHNITSHLKSGNRSTGKNAKSSGQKGVSDDYSVIQRRAVSTHHDVFSCSKVETRNGCVADPVEVARDCMLQCRTKAAEEFDHLDKISGMMR